MSDKRFSLHASFLCAFRGILDAARERNFKIELCFMFLCIICGFVFSISFVEWLVVILCFGLVLGGECLNTAIEAIVDLASPEHHELARLAKDAAAGGVLIFSLASLVIGLCIFVPRIVTLLGLSA